MYFSADPGPRREFIGGLCELAAFLEANPDVPVPLYSNKLQLCAAGSDAEMFAEVDRVAALLGVTPVRRGHYTASRRFGPIEFEVYAIPAASHAEHQARHSYDANITLTGDEATPAA